MKYFKSILFALLFPSIISAQNIEVTTIDFDDNSFTANVLLMDVPLDQLSDYWDDYWKENYDVKISREDRSRDFEVYLAEQIRMSQVSDKAFDLWSKLVVMGEEQTSVALAVSFGYDINASPDAFSRSFNASEDLLLEFRDYAYNRYFNGQIEEVQDALADVRDNREDAVDDQEKSSRRIEKWQDKIRKYEEKIAEERQELVAEENEASQAEDEIANLEYELSRLQNLRSEYLNGRK
ncbi:MAG: hypothetical protein AAFP08_14460 [Bacteroidota bacterium]